MFFKFSRPSSSTQGMTILEVIAVVAIIGILSAIAAPGWVTFANRQRANRATDQVLQSIRSAQADAKRTRRTRTIEFDKNADVPQLITNGAAIPLGEGDLKPGMVDLSVKEDDGADLDTMSFTSTGGLESVNLPVTITVAIPADSDSPVKKCVIVRSLLGATQTASGDDCAS